MKKKHLFFLKILCYSNIVMMVDLFFLTG
uniref:Uncharacterized protein n=1 Tax=Anguilla anguilla TaxID=7936 RepID=A0A0E9S0V5_ANGAN